MSITQDLMRVLPELFLACAGMALLLVGAFRGPSSTRLVTWGTVASMIITAVLLLTAPEANETALFSMFVTDAFAVFAKTLILTATTFALVLSVRYLEQEQIARPEYPVLMLFATIGMMLMVSAHDLITLYVGLELQSLSLYVIAAFRRDNAKSSEAGLKYFVLGALSSGLLLYGSSLIYGFAGTTVFADIAAKLGDGSGANLGIVVGLVFIMAGLAFKISAVPFHMWTPDVYEGAPTSVTAFFAVAPKVAAMCLLIRVLVDPFGDLLAQWQQVIWFCAVGSMVLGALGAIRQTNIKRLMAYSSIGHIGYALVGLAAGTEAGVKGVLIYLSIYLAMNVGTFAIILSMRQGGRTVEQVEDLKGLYRDHPGMAMAMAVFLFSMAGVPPLAGFFGKLAVFTAAVDAGLLGLAIVGVLASVASCFYYIRIIKLMYFQEPLEVIDKPGRTVSLIVMGTALFTFPIFYVFANPILAGAAAAASSLFQP